VSRAPLLLALDTSTSTAGVALYDGRQVLSETTWRAGREHSTRLLIEIEAALTRVGHVAGDLTGLVVARGPGSYTGVRVALSVAKGMAAALGIPLWGVGSLDVLAHAAGQVDIPVRAVLEAGRGRFATAAYQDGERTAPARLATLDELAGLLAGATDQVLVVGDLTPEARARLGAEPSVRLASPAACLRRSGFLAELGWRLAVAGDPGDPSAVDAVYVGAGA
jgi:tRNA threonylcarbamoyladenosine biosynthesis protein TsaB